MRWPNVNLCALGHKGSPNSSLGLSNKQASLIVSRHLTWLTVIEDPTNNQVVDLTYISCQK